MSPLRSRALAIIGLGISLACQSVLAAMPGEPLTPRVEVSPNSGGFFFGAAQSRIAVAANGGFTVMWTAVRQVNDKPAGFAATRTFLPLADPVTDPVTLPAPNVFGTDGRLQPVATRAGRGTVVASYVAGEKTSSNDSRYIVQRLSEGGLPLGDPIEVDRTQGSGAKIVEAQDPAVAMRPDGGFIVAWTVLTLNTPNTLLNDAPPSFYSSQLFIRRYDAAGQPEGPKQVIAERLVTRIFAGVRIVMSAQGDYAVLYRQLSLAPQRPLDPLAFPFFARVFRAGSTGPGVPIHFATLGERQRHLSDGPVIGCFTANGDLLLGWTAKNKRLSATEEQLLVRHYSLNGLPRGAVVEVARRLIEGGDGGFSLNPQPAGGYTVAWIDYARPDDGSPFFPYSYKGRALGRYYAANDVPLGEPFVIDDDAYQIDAGTDARGNLVALFNPLYLDPVYSLGPAYVRVFQGP